jgi:photosystem II stability/assembly factor-like uncharacterized protein
MHARVVHVLRNVGVVGTLAGLAAAGPAVAGAAVGPDVLLSGSAAGFAPAAVSFWSAGRGVALGGVSCRQGGPCAARLTATSDGGAHWHFLPAPAVSVVGGRHARSVSHVLFTSARRGWLYRSALWSTRDGGGHWRKIVLGGAVETMAASAGKVYALVSQPAGRAPELFTTLAGRDSWARVGHVSGRVLAVYGRSAWVGSARHLWATADGRHWHEYPFRCPAKARSVGLASIAAASPERVLFLCLGEPAGPMQVKDLLGSANGGRTSHLIRSLPLGGDGGVIAVPPGRPRVITLGTEYYLDSSADGGKTWTRKLVTAGGGAPWNSLAYLTRAVGWAEVGTPPTFNGLLHTTNAGRTWRPIRF